MLHVPHYRLQIYRTHPLSTPKFAPYKAFFAIMKTVVVAADGVQGVIIIDSGLYFLIT